MSYPSFPKLSRAPSLRTRESTLDPTLRDTMENGMVSTRARFTRRRRKFTWAIDFLTPDDKRTLENFVALTVQFGALPFHFADPRFTRSPQNYLVRFSVLPTFADAGWVEGFFRHNTTFEIEEM